MASQTFKNFKHYASLLEQELGIKYDAKPYKETIRIMLDGFCKATDECDEHRKNLFIAGLMLRFWDKIGKLEQACPNIGMHGEDFVDWLYEAIILACEYRKWQKDESVNAQQCINQCVETVRVRHYYEMNLDKHKASYSTISLELPIGEESDGGVQKTLGDTIVDEQAEQEVKLADGDSLARHVVQAFLNRNRIVEAIILDVIAFGDTVKENKKVKKGIDENGETYKYTTYTQEFWRFKAVQLLANLPEDYFDYFVESYSVKTEAFKAALEVLKKANNNKLYRELDASLRAAKTIFKGAI